MEYFLIYMAVGIAITIIAYAYDYFFDRESLRGTTLGKFLRHLFVGGLCWPFLSVAFIWIVAIKPFLNKEIF